MSVLDDICIDRVLPGQYALRLDPVVRLVMPWYTHGALDAIAEMDFSNKTVFEWGGGCSTFWWSRVSERVFTVEAHQEWADWITATALARGFGNISVSCCFPTDRDGYLRVPDGCEPDVVCVDGSLRTECVARALTFKRPLLLIVDNWQQDGVYIDPVLERVMSAFPGRFFVQADHTAHEGKPWQTAIWHLDDSMPRPESYSAYDERGIGSWHPEVSA